MSKKLICHPKHQGNRINRINCLSKDDVLKLSNLHSNIISDVNEDKPDELLQSLKLLHSCKHEICLIKKLVTNHDDQTEMLANFAPFAPESWKNKPKTWLNSNDIRNVLNQYEEVDPEFCFIGPSPIDWEYQKTDKCVCQKLCDFDLNEYETLGKKKSVHCFQL